MHEHEILSMTIVFERTGHIDDSLIPYFDQHGKWLGAKRQWRRDTYDKARARMAGAMLPEWRRTRRGRMGTQLLTSFRWNESTPVMIPHVEVGGSVVLQGDAPVRAPSLWRIGGNLDTRTKLAVQMPYLRTVGGSLDSLRTLCVAAPRLREVGGDCRMNGCDFPSLAEVGGSLYIRWAFVVSAPNLTRIGGSLRLHKSTCVDMPLLRTVGRHFLADALVEQVCVPSLLDVGGNLLVPSAERIVAWKLRSVGGLINSIRARGFYRDGITFGDWWMYPGDREHWEARKRVREVIRGDNHDLVL
jgi:hypothetical protein